MIRIRKIGKWAGIGLVGAIACVLLGYGALLLVNLEDEPPSGAARSFAILVELNGDLDSPENAVPFLKGIDAPREADPWELGTERIQWGQRHPNEPADEGDRAGVSMRTILEAGDTGLDEWIDVCNPVGRDCLRRLHRDAGELSGAPHDVEWMLDRYERLLQREAWHEPPPDLFSVWGYSATSSMGRLYGLRAWLVAKEKGVSEALARLDQEARFWRMALAESKTIIGKIIATVQLRWNLGWTNAVLSLAGESGSSIRAGSWGQPLTAEERSMRRAFAGELYIFRRSVLPIEEALRRAPWFDRVLWRLGEPLLQLQATENLVAAKYQRIHQALSVPYGRLPAELEALRTERSARHDDLGWLVPYNPVGRLTLRVFAELPLEDYGIRIADLEGARRATLLAASLRAEGIPADRVPDRLAHADLRNPYSGKAFSWDAETESLIFEGLTPHGRGDFAVPY